MALATNSTAGSVVLGGDLTGSAYSPQLRVTGVIPGTYGPATIVSDAKGRIVYAKQTTSKEIMDILPPASDIVPGPIQVCDQLKMVVNALTLDMQDALHTPPTYNITGNIVNGVLSVTESTSHIWVGDHIWFDDNADSVGAPTTNPHNLLEMEVTAILGTNQYQLDTLANFEMNVFDSGHTDGLYHVCDHRAFGKVEIGEGLEVENGLVKLPYATIYSKGIMEPGDGLDAIGGVLQLGDTLVGMHGTVIVGANIDVNDGVISYTSPDATTSTPGYVQVGAGLAVADGVLSWPAPADPVASTSNKGYVQVGSNITLTGTTISIDEATTTALGVIQAGSGIGVLDGSLSVNDATYTTKGLAQVGAGIAVTDGIVSVAIGSPTLKGIVQIGTNIDVSGGTISVKTSSAAQLGVVQVGTNIDVSGGTISVATGSASAKGLVQVGTNIDVSAGTISVATGSASQLGVVQIGDGLSVTDGVVDTSSTVLRTTVASATTVSQHKTTYALSGSPINWDGTGGNIMSATLTANTTLNNGTNVVPGTYYNFIISGEYIITYGSQFKFKPNSQTQPIGTTSVLSCYAVDADTLYCIMQPNFV